MVPTDPGFYRNLLDHVRDGVYFVDPDRQILYWNAGACRLSGYKAEEVLGRHCQDNILCHVDSFGTNLCRKGCPLAASIADGKMHKADIFLRNKQGRIVPVSVLVQPMRGADGALIGAVEIFNDNTAEIETRRRMEIMNRLAFLDHLTDLPNRRFLEMSLQTAISEYRVHKEPFGVLVMDLNAFKSINDSFGHPSGDQALQIVGGILAGALHPTDVVGRWGGDEFVAIVHNVNSEILGKLAKRCVDHVAQTKVPFKDEKRISLSISVGAALSRPGDTAKTLFRRADNLMYRNKNSGRKQVAEE